MPFLKTIKDEINQTRFLLETGGLPRWWQHVVQNGIAFDLKYGTDTARWLDRPDFPQHLPNITHLRRYRCSLQSELKAAFDATVDYLGRKSVRPQEAGFYDLGCGKGKPPLYAALHYEFKSVTGIDFHEGLVAVFRRNIGRAKEWSVLHGGAERAAQLDRIRAVTGDVADFKAYSDTSIVYMYFPFDAEITGKVSDNIRENTARSLIIYNYPHHEQILRDQGWQCVWEKLSPNPDQTTRIFSYGF